MTDHVVYLSIDGMTDPLGQSQVLPYLGGLSRAGYNITLVSCEKPDRYEAGAARIRAVCEDSGIDWRPTEYRNRPPLLSSFGNIRRMRIIAEKACKDDPPCIIHCRSYLPMFAGLALKRKFKAKLLFDARGFWPDERVDGGLWNLGQPMWKAIYRYFKRKELEFFGSADRVITLTEAARNEVLSWPMAENPKPIDVIPCCADLDLFDYRNVSEAELEELRASLDLKADDFVLSYLGSLGTFYAAEDMLRYFMELKKVEPGAKFLFITASDPQIVWDAVHDLGIDPQDIRVTRSPRERVPHHLLLSRYSLVFYRENYSRLGCSPTKLGELMGLGIPVVCSPNIGDTTSIVNRSRCGTTVGRLDPEDYRKAVEYMAGFPFEDREAIREQAGVHFDLQAGIEKYRNVYDAMC